MRCPLVVLSFVFAIGFGAAENSLAVGGQTAVGSVTGRVLNAPDGYVLPGATVWLTGADGRERRAVADEQGRYQIDELPRGRYDLGSTNSLSRRTARCRDVR